MTTHVPVRYVVEVLDNYTNIASRTEPMDYRAAEVRRISLERELEPAQYTVTVRMYKP